MLDTDPPGARSIAEEVVALAPEIGDSTALATGLFVIGSARVDAGEYEGAESDLHRALELAGTLGDHGLQSRVLRALLRCAFLTQNSDVALLRGIQALQIAREHGDAATQATAHNDLGLVYGNLGDFEGALEHLLAGLRLSREAGQARSASLLNNIGNVYLELGDLQEALEFFESSFEVFEEERAERGQGIALGNIGRVHSLSGRHEDALAAFEKSVRIFEQRGFEAYRAPALSRCGSALAELGRIDEAEAAFAEALELIESSGWREFEDEVLIAAAQFRLKRNDPDGSLVLLERALRLLDDGELTKRSYEIQKGISEAWEAKGDALKALQHFKEFHRLHQTVSDTAMAVRIRGLMLQFDVEQARQQEEIFRLRNIELAEANADLRALQLELEEKNRQLQRISIQDPLTGLYNRRYLELQLNTEVARAKRHGRPLTVAMCDLDHFKPINDRYSHVVGDEVLRRVGEVLRKELRVSDVAVRYGGEEFLVILPDTDLAGAHLLADRIRRAVSGHAWDEVAPDLHVTMSIGVAQLSRVGDAAALLSAADERLYQAKRQGRDRIVI